MSHVTLLTGPERRRRWHAEDRRRILAAAFAPGAVVADVARQYEISTGLIYTWRRQSLAVESGAAFVPGIVVDEPAPVLPTSSAPAITVDLAGRVRVRIEATAPAALVAAALRALR
jgi:transposase